MDRKTEHVAARDLLPAAIIAAGQIVAAEIAQGRMKYEEMKLDKTTGPMYELIAKLVENGREIAKTFYEESSD